MIFQKHVLSQVFTAFPAPYWAAPGAAIYLGDVRERLKDLPTRSVHQVVTSPPYWGLRDYGTGEWEGGSDRCNHIRDFVPRAERQSGNHNVGKGGATNNAQDIAANIYKGMCGKCGAVRIDSQIGNEPVADCAGWATGAACGECYVCHMVDVFVEVRRVLRDDGTLWLNLGDTYENTELKGIPWRVALALQASGWKLCADMPWIKRNAMPESAQNRPSKNVENVFQLAKADGYFFDMESVKQPGSRLMGGACFGKQGSEQYREYDRPDYKKRAWRAGDVWLSSTGIEGFDTPTINYPGAHYATFAPRLITPMIQAGTSEHGCCAACGKPYVPIVEKDSAGERVEDDGQDRDRSFRHSRNGLDSNLHANDGGVLSSIVGWRKVCGCDCLEVLPAVILDPFVGSGTTVATAINLGRVGVGIDLSEKYIRENAIPRIETAVRGERVAHRAVPVVKKDTPPPPQSIF